MAQDVLCTFHVVTELLASRRSRGEAMFRGGSFDRSGAGLELHEEYSKFPIPIGFGRLKEPAHISPASWNRTWSPQGCGARRRWQSAISKSFFNGSDVVSAVASPRSPVDIAGNQVHMFAEHHRSNRVNEFFPNTTFLA